MFYFQLKVFGPEDSPLWDFNEEESNDFLEMIDDLAFRKLNSFEAEEIDIKFHRPGYSGFMVDSDGDWDHWFMILGNQVVRIDGNEEFELAEDTDQTIEKYLANKVRDLEPILYNLIG